LARPHVASRPPSLPRIWNTGALSTASLPESLDHGQTGAGGIAVLNADLETSAHLAGPMRQAAQIITFGKARTGRLVMCTSPTAP
jgi:hypothetical protein